MSMSAVDVSRRINEAVAPSRPPSKEVQAEVQPIEYTFDVDYKAPNGRRYQGRFAAKIMSVKDRIMVGVLRSQLCAGLSPDLLDVETQNLTEMVATIQVVCAERPDWAKDLVGMRDPEVVWQIYKEVSAREARFQNGTIETSPGTPEESRVQGADVVGGDLQSS